MKSLLTSLFFSSFFVYFQCVPDPRKDLPLPAPTNVEVSTSRQSITLKITGSYDKTTFPSFIGYNVYVGFLNNPSEIQKRLVFFDILPTVAAAPGEINKSLTMNRTFSYKNLFEDKENNIKKDSITRDEPITTFSNYYFIVKPINNFKKEGPQNQQLLYVKPFETKNGEKFTRTSENSGNLNIKEIFEMQINTTENTITPLNETGIISYGYRDNVVEIKEIPSKESSAYSKTEKVILKKNYLYAISKDVHYLKLYIVEISGDTIIYDYSYQQQEGIFR